MKKLSKTNIIVIVILFFLSIVVYTFGDNSYYSRAANKLNGDKAVLVPLVMSKSTIRQGGSSNYNSSGSSSSRSTYGGGSSYGK